MTDSQAPIDDRNANIRALVSRYVNDAHESLFDRLDGLKKRNINDDDVIRALRGNLDSRIAEEYIEWSDAIDPDVDPTPEEGGVTDPHDAPSYDAMGKGPELPSIPKRQSYEGQIAELKLDVERDYRNDPKFKHDATMVSDLLNRLATSEHSGDTRYAGAMVIALLKKFSA